VHSAALGAGIALCATRATSAPKANQPSAACSAAFAQAREQEQQNHLSAARDTALSCSKAACGEQMALQCRTTFQRLENEAPSVIPLAVDDKGAPLVDVEVRVDGEAFTQRLDGRGLPVDPGLHEFAFQAPGRAPYSEKLVILQGQRNRAISVTLRTSTPSAAAASASLVAVAPPLADVHSADRGEATGSPEGQAPATSAATLAQTGPATSVWPFVIGGVGVASLGASLVFVTWGQHDNDLLDQCAPNCSGESVDHVKSLYLAADISLGVGVAALGVATWLYLSNSGDADPSEDRAGLTVDVNPIPSGAFASVAGSF